MITQPRTVLCALTLTFAGTAATAHAAGMGAPFAGQRQLRRRVGAGTTADTRSPRRRREDLEELLADPDAVDLDSFPSPACSHNDSTSRVDRPRTNAPMTIARSGSVLSNLVPRGNSLDTNGSAAARTCRISTESSPTAVCTFLGRKPLRSPC